MEPSVGWGASASLEGSAGMNSGSRGAGSADSADGGVGLLGSKLRSWLAMCWNSLGLSAGLSGSVSKLGSSVGSGGIGVRSVFRRGGDDDGGRFGDDHGFGIEEFAHADGGEFATVAGALDAAEGEARVGGDHGVEEDGAGLDFYGEALAFGVVGGPGGGGEAEGCVVGELDGFVERGDAEEQGDGAEEFFLGDGRVAHDASDDGGLEVVAEVAVFDEGAGAAGEDAAAGLAGLGDLVEKIFDGLGCGEGAEVGSFEHGVADAKGGHGGDEALFELRVDAFVDDEAFRGDAGLAVVDAASLDGVLYGEVEVGRRQDDEGVGAAELEDRFFDEPAGLGSDGAAGGLGAGEGDGGDAGVVEEVLYLAGLDEEGLEDAAGEAGAADQCFNGERALGDVGGVLEEADVAGHERGGEEAEDLPEGEVPGHDGEDDAEWVVADVGFFLVGGVGCVKGDAFGGEDTGGIVGVVAAAGGAFGDFGAGRDEGLTHLGGHGDGELFDVGFEEGGESAHPEHALVEGFPGIGFGGARGEG